MKQFVRTLREIGRSDLELVGGKGANLGELVRAGVPVPAAFCLTTDAYREMLASGNLRDKIRAIVDEIDYADPAGIERDAARVRDLICRAPAPAAVVEEIAEAYADLEAELGASVPVSVRSSATAEDLPGASFAGQQDTYLHISGRDEVIDAVRRCWASLWTDRAIAYRQVQGFEHDGVYLAVVVQEMFPSEVAGVMFTANPVTSNPFEVFLNMSWGLGEAIVSGQVNPDQLIVDKRTWEIVDRHVAEKLLMTVPDPSGQGSVTVGVEPERQTVQALDDSLVRDLCEIGMQIERHYAYYQDIEWGYADGRFAILQAREITGADLDFGHELETWKTPAALESMYDQRWTWSRAYSDEVQTGPSTPSFYSGLQSAMTYLKAMALMFTNRSTFLEYTPEQFLDVPFFRWYGARAYYNLDFERERVRLFTPPFARDDAALWPFPAAEREEIRNLPFDWEGFLSLFRDLHESSFDISLLGTTRVVYDGLQGWIEAEDTFWEGIDLEASSVQQILDAQIEAMGASGSRFLENVVLPFTIYLYLLPPALEELCRSWFDDDGQIYGRLVGGLQTMTSEENIAVWTLSRSVVDSPGVLAAFRETDDALLATDLQDVDGGEEFLAETQAFLDEFGHRGGAERDAYHRRWRDDWPLLFRAVRLMLDLDDTQSPPEHERRQREVMRETRRACVEQLRSASDDLGDFWWIGDLNRLAAEPADSKAELFEWFVDLVQDYCYYRDFERFHNDKSMSRVRSHYEAIGRKLVAAGAVEQEDDVFFLSRQEMAPVSIGEISSQEARNRVRSRRRVYEKYSHQEPPKFLRGWEAFDDDVIDADGALVGIGASSGVVSGTARVCRDLSDIGKVRPGDILVTVATDPGWTTVFSILGGVVVETGGVVAHAVMISREYGLPCVSNLTRACDEIPDGATITIDGGRGLVLVEPAS